MPVTAIRVSAGIERIWVACLVAAFLIACASSTTTRRQLILRSATASRAARAYVVITRSAAAAASVNAAPRARSAPWWTCTRSSGVNRAASRCQFPTSDIGQISSGARRRTPPIRPVVGADAATASSWTVLPRPMSSASTPPSPERPRKSNQDRPLAWYGRSCPMNDVGGWIGASRRSASPASRSPSQPSAATSVTGSSSSAASTPRPSRSSSPTEAWPVVPAIRSPAASRRASSSIHWPRSRTSDDLASDNAASSSTVRVSSPTARS